MSENRPKNIGASVRQRLLNLSREQSTDFGVILSNYALERFLYRLGCSEYKNRFILKGAMLFRIWYDEPYRATRDLDLLAFGDPAAEEIGLIFRDICAISAEDDGVEFQADALRTDDIREGQEYQGVRVHLNAIIAGARVPLQIDIGFGDIVTPMAEEISYPTILDYPAAHIRAYPKEIVIAEKFQAMVALGIANSRMKDFYDIYSLAASYEFNGSSICSAIRATFERRSTPLPISAPTALSSEFFQDQLKLTQWRAFTTGGNVRLASLSLEEVEGLLTQFLIPPVNAVSEGKPFNAKWSPPGPWAK